jgi:hypothetical protein
MAIVSRRRRRRVVRGTEVRLTAGTRDAYEADVHAVEGTPNGNGFVVGWYEKAADKALVPRRGLGSRNGTARWITTLSSRGRNTVARVRGSASSPERLRGGLHLARIPARLRRGAGLVEK